MNKYVVIIVVAAILAASWGWLGREKSGSIAIEVPSQGERQSSERAVESNVAAGINAAQNVQRPTSLPDGARQPPAATPTRSPSPDHLQLWEGPFRAGTADQVAALTFKVDPEKLQRLSTGQTLSFSLGGRGQIVRAEVQSTANPSPDVQTWQGAVLDRQPQDNLIIARGPQQTHITVFTDATTYSVVIDNDTGEASLVDEGDLHEITVPYEDGIVLPEVPDSLPPL